jgi:hypothetical protein
MCSTFILLAAIASSEFKTSAFGTNRRPVSSINPRYRYLQRDRERQTERQTETDRETEREGERQMPHAYACKKTGSVYARAPLIF